MATNSVTPLEIDSDMAELDAKTIEFNVMLHMEHTSVSRRGTGRISTCMTPSNLPQVSIFERICPGSENRYCLSRVEVLAIHKNSPGSRFDYSLE